MYIRVNISEDHLFLVNTDNLSFISVEPKPKTEDSKGLEEKTEEKDIVLVKLMMTNGQSISFDSSDPSVLIERLTATNPDAKE